MPETPTDEFAASSPECGTPEIIAALGTVSSAFASLGRVLLCVDQSFRVLHASAHIEEVAGAGAAERVPGRPLAELLGNDLFGPAGTLRQLLRANERREGWRATLTVDGSSPRLVSLSAAPFRAEPGVVCDSRVAYVVVLRPAEMEGPTTLPPLPGLVGRSRAMESIFRSVLNLDGSEATILFTGERGTGKALIARTLHDRSLRREGPFVVMSCRSLPEETLESELFGHVAGAVASSPRERIGRVQAASGGTLFLEEVNRLPAALQYRLLTLLLERSFQRKGSNEKQPSNARIMASSELDLHEAVERGEFREDLYYRLNVVPMEIPPLRERRDDIEPLATFLLARAGARQGRALRFSPDALRTLLDHQWPGNVRELESVLEYAVAVCKGQTMLPEDLPVEIRNEPFPSRPASPLPTDSPFGGDPPTGAPLPANDPASEPSSPDVTELVQALEASRWRRSAAARALGISRTTLWRRMREAGLD
jgi:DNA-binding NtrC family response regulator